MPGCVVCRQTPKKYIYICENIYNQKSKFVFNERVTAFVVEHASEYIIGTNVPSKR